MTTFLTHQFSGGPPVPSSQVLDELRRNTAATGSFQAWAQEVIDWSAAMSAYTQSLEDRIVADSARMQSLEGRIAELEARLN